MANGWVLRIAAELRVCTNCDDRIEIGERYFRMLTGERFCWLCPPEEDTGCSL